MDFSRRSYNKELLDREDTPFEDIRQNMVELEFINKWLGGHRITLGGLDILLKDHVNHNEQITIAEIGCGGGDNLVAVKKWCTKKKLRPLLIGVDINEHCIEVAREKLKDSDHRLIHSDYRLVNFEADKPDIIFSSLFCHHFTDEALIDMMKWMDRNSGSGFFINDLHRHPLAYYSIKTLTGLFSHSYLVKNDAPLSVRRGFKKSEWQYILDQAGINNYKVRWQWAFRFLVTAPAHKTFKV